jgi:hypothetical protein
MKLGRRGRTSRRIEQQAMTFMGIELNTISELAYRNSFFKQDPIVKGTYLDRRSCDHR